ncbi:MAG TPA: peptidylprolyl isomerase [Gaiellaceae bacterium]|jgi:peptidyl-prolyl cis-trans isomerase A (cyclophilin A)
MTSRRALAVACVAGGLAIATPAVGRSAPRPSLLEPSTLVARAPAKFSVSFATTKGVFVVSVRRAWAPHGADRFYNLVRNRFYDGASFFRVVPGFVVQFGISPRPAVSRAWLDATIPDDRVRLSNKRGTLAFAATNAPNSRTTQVFVNLGDNRQLDSSGFAPFARVVRGMRVVDRLYAGYGELPDQGKIVTQGRPYLDRRFPKLDRITIARVVRGSG